MEGSDVMNAVVFRERWAVRISVASTIVLGLGGALFLAAGRTLTGILWLAFAAIDARFALSLVVLRDGEIHLHTFWGVRTIPSAEVTWVDPKFKGWWMRTPRLGLKSGQIVELTSLRLPTQLVGHSAAAEALGRALGVPVRSNQPPSGWYPDPGAETGFRHWDGAAWTSLHRSEDGSLLRDGMNLPKHYAAPAGYPIRDRFD
jgi:hypothetical protein